MADLNWLSYPATWLVVLAITLIGWGVLALRSGPDRKVRGARGVALSVAGVVAMAVGATLLFPFALRILDRTGATKGQSSDLPTVVFGLIVTLAAAFAVYIAERNDRASVELREKFLETKLLADEAGRAVVTLKNELSKVEQDLVVQASRLESYFAVTEELTTLQDTATDSHARRLHLLALQEVCTSADLPSLKFAVIHAVDGVDTATDFKPKVTVIVAVLKHLATWQKYHPEMDSETSDLIAKFGSIYD